MEFKIQGILKSRFVIYLLIALVIVGGGSVGFARYIDNTAKEVVLCEGEYSVRIITLEKTVEKLLNKYGIEIRPEDEVEPAPCTELSEGTVIKIKRGMKVNIRADGKEKSVFLTEGTVKDALDKAGIVLGERDLVNWSLSEQLFPNMCIIVTRIDEKIVEEKESIPYKVITRKNSNMDEGVEKVIRKGKEGELCRKIKVVYRDGVEVSREVLEEKIVANPVNEIVERGTVKRKITSRGDVIRYSSVMTFVATAYSIDEKQCGKTNGITASGKKVKPYHTIAAPAWIPFGTKVYIPELVEFWKRQGVDISGIFVVEDRGGDIKGRRLDIYMEDKATCLKFGRRKVTVYFLK